MDSLHRQGSIRSSSSAAAALNSVVRVTDATRRAQKFPPSHRWSSYERLKLQAKDLEVLANKASNSAEHSRSLFYTPVRHRRANTPESPGEAGLPPRPPSFPRSSASNDHDKSGALFQTTSGLAHGIPAHATQSTSRDHQIKAEDLTQPTGKLTSSLDQLLVELNSPLHSESAPILTVAVSSE